MAFRFRRKSKLTPYSGKPGCSDTTEKLTLTSKIIYDFFYRIGTIFLRVFFRVLRQVSSKSSRVAKKWAKKVSVAWSAVLDLLKFIGKEFARAMLMIVYFPIKFFSSLHKAFKSGGFVFMLRSAKNIIVNGYSVFFREMRILFCYAMPIAALILLLNTVSGFNASDYVVAVNYDGQFVGYVSDEAVYTNAEKLMQDRIVYSGEQNQITITPELKVAKLVYGQAVSDEYEICNKLIEASGEVINEGYGLYVDGQFYGATVDGEALAIALESMLERYSSSVEGEVVSFVNDVQVKNGLFPESSIVDCSVLEKLISSETEGKRTYTVQAGDAPYTIAQKNGISYSAFKNLNPGIEEKCMPGQVVTIANSKPFLAVKTTYTETDEVKISYKTISTSSNKYSKGTTKVVVSGKNGTALQTSEKVYIDGVLSAVNVLSTEVLTEPVDREIIIGTYVNTTASTGSGKYTGKFIWPVDGGYVSCGINGYKGHTGMDIAAARGTNIRASMAGRVITVKKQNYGYGYHIIIDHGNGVQTVYAHCSKLLVSLGDYVEQGEIIAKVGSTGNSTGNHCHFEIRINKQYKNPANYIGTKYNR